VVDAHETAHDAIRSATDAHETATDAIRSVIDSIGKRTDRSENRPIGPFLYRRPTFNVRNLLKFHNRPSRRRLEHRMP
jgi:hypothetical protein